MEEEDDWQESEEESALSGTTGRVFTLTDKMVLYIGGEFRRNKEMLLNRHINMGGNRSTW